MCPSCTCMSILICVCVVITHKSNDIAPHALIYREIPGGMCVYLAVPYMS